MRRPGDRAPKQPRSGAPTPCVTAEGYDGGPSNVDVDRPCPPGSKSSACAQMSLARKPGDLDEASRFVVDRRQPREGDEPKSVARCVEESDAAVVSEKPAKTWVTPVESVEKRAAAKRKFAVRNALRAQDRDGALTYLQRIGKQAKQEPQMRFTNLLVHVKVPLLKEAYQRLSKRAASGVDGVTWVEFGERLDERLLDLQDRIHRGSYHPQPVRRVHIPKGDGGTRPLGIPALEDKVVQQAVRMVLEPIYESMFMGFSYGFRPGRGAHDGLDAWAFALTTKRVNWVLDADIRSFFDTIDHGWMQRFLEHRIGDKRLVRLVMKWMRTGVMEDGVLYAVEEGTPQGGVISPLLANIYLHYVLDLWVQQWRRKHATGEMYVVRYADDFVMGFERERDARVMREAVASRLAKFGLEIHPEKTRVLQFGRFARMGRERLGLRRPETFDFLGFTHIAGVSRRGAFQLQRRTSRKKRSDKLARIAQECRRRRHAPVPDQHAWLVRVLVGHYRYYAVPTNFPALAKYYRAVREMWHRGLQRRSDRARWTRPKRDAFDKRFPLPTPTIVHPWPDQRFAPR